MSKSRWGWSAHTPVPPEKACAWMFDLREDDHMTPEHKAMVKLKPGDGRKIISRSHEEVVVEDRVGGGPAFQATLHKDSPTELHVHSAGPKSTMDAHYRFAPEGEGSRLTTEVEVEAHGFLGFLMPLLRRKFERIHQMDMGIHVTYMDREWRSSPW